jgi:hypothetical protein
VYFAPENIAGAANRVTYLLHAIPLVVVGFFLHMEVLHSTPAAAACFPFFCKKNH